MSSLLVLAFAAGAPAAEGTDVPGLAGDRPGLAMSPPPAAIDWLEEGKRLYQTGELEAAAMAWERAAAADPRAIAPRLALGLVWLKTGRGQASVAAWLDAQRLAPADPLVAYHLGLAHVLAGQPAEARAAFERAIALDPGHAAARANLAALAAAPTSVPTPPLAQVTNVPSAAPSQAGWQPPTPMLLRRADARLASGDWDGAVAVLRDGVAARPADAALWRGLGRLFARRRDLLTAEALLRKALALAPADPATHLALARVLVADARYDAAASALAQARRTGARRADVETLAATLARARRDPGARWSALD